MSIIKNSVFCLAPSRLQWSWIKLPELWESPITRHAVSMLLSSAQRISLAFEQPGLLEGVPPQGRGRGTRWALGSLPTQTTLQFILYLNIFQFIATFPAQRLAISHVCKDEGTEGTCRSPHSLHHLLSCRHSESEHCAPKGPRHPLPVTCKVLPCIADSQAPL